MSRFDRLFTDKASGKDTQRPELERLLAFAREGDTVVVHSMDRLARNLDDLRLIVRKLTKRGVRIEFVKENLTFTGEDSPLANLMLSVMGAFAEFERALIRERQREGIALAKQRGAYRGRKKSLSLGAVGPATPAGAGWRAEGPPWPAPCSSTGWVNCATAASRTSATVASGLNLVVAAIVLWNTAYLERVVQALRDTGNADDSLLPHLSPLGLGAHQPDGRLQLAAEQAS